MARRDQQARFDRAADTFDSVDFVPAATRDGLFARMEPVTIDAQRIVDLGSATGASTRSLEKRFRGAIVISIDWSFRMLKKATKRSSWFKKTALVQADAMKLPLADRSIDIVFANLLLPWLDDRAAVFAEVARVLRKEGLFLFSTLGPDSLVGLRHAPFSDMHDIGDELVRAGLGDPVLDVDRLTVSYKSRESLESDLVALGAGDCMPDTLDGLDFELELIYGHCWASGVPASSGEVFVDVGTISRRVKP